MHQPMERRCAPSLKKVGYVELVILFEDHGPPAGGGGVEDARGDRWLGPGGPGRPIGARRRRGRRKVGGAGRGDALGPAAVALAGGRPRRFRTPWLPIAR